MQKSPFAGRRRPAPTSTTVSSTANDWFQRKFGAAIQASERKESANERKRKTNSYSDVKKKLEECLAVRRHDELERRYSFYNAENEIFEEPKDEEEEEGEEEEKEGEEEEKEGDEEEEEGEEDEEVREKERKEAKDGQGKKKEEQEKDEENGEDIEGRDEMEEEGEEEEEEEEDDEVGEKEKEEEAKDGQRKKKEEEEKEEENGEDNEGRDEMEEEEEEEEGEEDEEVGFDDFVEPNSTQECFDEALLLCSGQFEDDNIITNRSLNPFKTITSESAHDLFTVEDELGNPIAMESEDDEEEEVGPFPGDEEEAEEEEDEENEEEDELGPKTTAPKRKIKEMFDDEASLSGDDVGSDSDDEGGGGLDEYEAEEGDADKLPNEEEIRENLVRQYMKHQNDESDRRLLKLQEALFADSDLHGQGGSGDRSFRLRMHVDANVDWAKVLGSLDGDEVDENGGDGVDEQWQERRVQMVKWMEEEAEKRRKIAGKRKRRRDEEGEEDDRRMEEGGEEGEEDGEEEAEGTTGRQLAEVMDSPLFALGEQLVWQQSAGGGNSRKTMKGQSTSSQFHRSDHDQHNPTSSSTFTTSTTGLGLPDVCALPPPKRHADSLLSRASRLEALIKDGTKNALTVGQNALFTSEASRL